MINYKSGSYWSVSQSDLNNGNGDCLHELTKARGMHYGWVFFVDFEVVARNDALKDETGGAGLDHAARGPAKPILFIIL